MRTVPTQAAIWTGGDFTGAQAPMQRATIQVLSMAIERGKKWRFADYIFSQFAVPQELPNVRSIHYDRHTDTDAATMTMTLYNTEPLPLGTPVYPDDNGNYVYDQPGYFTFNRGLTSSTRWHHTTNQWQGLLAPDRVIRTFEGYGFTAAVIPELDTKMTPSGVWIIDEVEYQANGLITVTARDGGRLLLDELMFPPVVPLSRYPLNYTANYPVANPPIVHSASGWLVPAYDTDSGVPYVGANGSIYGHHPSDALDTNVNTYWLSIGNAQPRADYAFEYVQGKFSGVKDFRYVQLRTWGGPYVAYISVYENGVWRGAGIVPYNAEDAVSAPNGADIPFVKRVNLPANDLATIDLGRIYHGTKIRVCLTNLTNSKLGPYPYRGGLRTFQVGATVTTTSPGGTHMVGDFGDYSEIVKQLLAWAGFHWPRNNNQAIITLSDGSRQHHPAPSDDPAIGGVGDGRVWGDIEMAGTGGIPRTNLGPEIWDKKPIMDGIAYVRDILGFIFFIDETGAAVFRSPNIWKIGNFVGDGATGLAYVGGEDSLVVIDENQTLISLSVRLSSRDQRERVFVSNTSGKIGAAAAGHTGPSGPFEANLQRVAGWTDQNFASTKECQVMADLITLRQLFQYRTDRLRIPGYSAIQIDDQVKIFEGTTSEDFIHYVVGLSSDWNIETGEWWYDLDTHWLGEHPSDKWAFNPTDLSQDTQTYLQTLGRL